MNITLNMLFEQVPQEEKGYVCYDMLRLLCTSFCNRCLGFWLGGKVARIKPDVTQTLSRNFNQAYQAHRTCGRTCK